MPPLHPIPRQSQNGQPRCPICKQPVSLETSKTDEDGNAIHEECYVAKVRPEWKREPQENRK